jgi:hypothetical protein
MRKRLFASEVITANEFQAESKNAPQGADFYIRETINTLDVTANFQNGTLHQFLVTYDIFASRKVYAGITGKLYSAADIITQEFTEDPDKMLISLPDLPNCTAYLERLVQYGAISQEEDLFHLPVQIYINVQERA